MRIENLLSSAEKYLSYGAAYPIIGIIPGMVKIGMGGTQCLSGLACTIIFSTLTIFDSNYKSLRDRSISHIIHGAANIVAGIVEGTPFVGFVVFFVRIIKSKVEGEKIKEIDLIGIKMRRHGAAVSSFYNAIWGQKFDNDPKNYVLVSPNNFKFIGYKILQEDTDTFYQEEDAYYHSLNSSDAIDPNTKVYLSAKKQFQETNANARFFDAPWGPILIV